MIERQIWRYDGRAMFFSSTHQARLFKTAFNELRGCMAALGQLPTLDELLCDLCCQLDVAAAERC